MKGLRLLVATGLIAMGITGCDLLDPNAHIADIKPVWKLEDPKGWGGYGPLNLVGDMAISSYPWSTWAVGINLKERRFVWWNSSYSHEIRYIPAKDGFFYTYGGDKAQNAPYRLWVARIDTGELVRSVELPYLQGSDPLNLHPVIHKDRLFLVSEDILVAYAIEDASRPHEVWRVRVPFFPWAMEIDEEGDIYVGGTSQYRFRVEGHPSLHKYSGEDGRLVWRAYTKYSDLNRPDDVKSWYEGVESIGFDGDRVVVSAGATLQAFDRRTGRRLWVSPEVQCGGVVEGGFGGPIEFGGGKAYVLRNSNVCFHAFDLSDGSIAWTVDAGQVAPWAKVTFGAANQKALYHNGVVYASNEHLWAVEAATGKVLAVSRTRAYQATSTAPVLYNGEIIVNGNPIYAYKPLR